MYICVQCVCGCGCRCFLYGASLDCRRILGYAELWTPLQSVSVPRKHDCMSKPHHTGVVLCVRTSLPLPQPPTHTQEQSEMKHAERWTAKLSPEARQLLLTQAISSGISDMQCIAMYVFCLCGCAVYCYVRPLPVWVCSVLRCV